MRTSIVSLVADFSSSFNAQIGAIRKMNNKGVYDPHTNHMHFPKNMQPTHARWEQVDDYAAEKQKAQVNGYRHEETETTFAPMPPIVSRNYMVVDTIYESSSQSNPGVPGPDGEDYDLGTNGLSTISDDLRDELPPDCRKAFEDALVAEKEWKNKWGTEDRDGSRRALRIDKGYFGFGL